MNFEVKVSTSDEHTTIRLTDNSSATFAEIYSYGALLNNFTSQHHGNTINVIDGFLNTADVEEKLTKSFKSAKLSPFACRVKNSSYSFAQNKHRLTKHFLNGTAIHGLVYNAPFEVAAQTSNEKCATVKLSYIYNNELEGYPFVYKIEVDYILEEQNTLTVITTITNLDEQLIPIADGWHPYFILGDSINDYQVQFQSKEMLEFDKELIPTGRLLPFKHFSSLTAFGATKLDNCFVLNFAEFQPMCVIRNPGKKVQIEFHPTESYPYLQIYTPEHRKSIAVENLSAAPDAFNNGMGLKVLEPNEVATFATKFIIRSL